MSHAEKMSRKTHRLLGARREGRNGHVAQKVGGTSHVSSRFLCEMETQNSKRVGGGLCAARGGKNIWEALDVTLCDDNY